MLKEEDKKQTNSQFCILYEQTHSNYFNAYIHIINVLLFYQRLIQFSFSWERSRKEYMVVFISFYPGVPFSSGRKERKNRISNEIRKNRKRRRVGERRRRQGRRGKENERTLKG